MKTNIINNYINFRGRFTPDEHLSLFRKMIEGSSMQSYYDKPDEIIEVWSPSDIRPEKVSIGRDIVKPAKIKKVPQPFELSDKKLILDFYQNNAVEKFRSGKNVMVTAPTGTGKTLIAEHIIDDILKSGKKVIYTTPLKALCNDKYKQFSHLWGDYDSKGNLIGSSKVGLATGDAKINTDAPLIVMTTEIYRNLLTTQGEKSAEKELKDVDAVIFDEFHYMGDNQRGSVWEEAVMFSPPKIKLLMLSATIANASPINNWLNNINTHHNSDIIAVPEEERHVPLKHYTFSTIRGTTGLFDLMDEKISLSELKKKELSTREKEAVDDIGKHSSYRDGEYTLKKILSPGEATNTSYFIKELERSGVPPIKAQQIGLRLSDPNKRYLNNSLYSIEPMNQVPLKELIISMKQNKMMPALYFVYSKKNCKSLMKNASETMGQLLTNEERNEVKKRIDEVQGKGIFLGTDFDTVLKPCLLNGFAMHNSGMLPQCKSFIEELGRSKLVKVCFATDTLGAGINFPFKTVIFSAFEKFSDGDFEEISVNTFKQGAGRAGRRGIDEVGYVISIPKDRDEVIIPYNKIINKPDDVKSAFTLSYSLLLSPRVLNNTESMLEKTFDYFQNQNLEENSKKCDEMKKLLKKHNCIEEKGEKFKLTEKGKIASRIKGINEILVSELLSEDSLLEGISPEYLAELISTFAPDREDNVNTINEIKHVTNDERMAKVISTALKIKEEEEEAGLDKTLTINTSLGAYINFWAKTPDGEDNSYVWSDLINTMREKNLIKDEGDFFKKVNYTINVLKQIQNVAKNQNLKNTAAKAIKNLQKSPVNDILLYELDYKENNE